MEKTSSGRKTSFEGVWHRAVKTNWAWIYLSQYWLFCVLGFLSGVSVKSLFSPFRSMDALVFSLEVGVGIFVLGPIISLPMTYWQDRNKVPVMLKFDDAGIAMKLKSGLVVEAGWSLVKNVRYSRWGKLTVIRMRGMFYPFTGNFPDDVKDALVARKERMRRGPSEPTAPVEPTLEDKVDKRLATIARM